MTPSLVLCDLAVTTRKQLFEKVAEALATEFGLNKHQITERLLEREKLLCSAAVNGVAVPQAELPGLSAPLGVVVTLKKPVDFVSVDRMPVDLVYVFLAPQSRGNENLRDLSRVMRTMQDEKTITLLRGATSMDAVQAILSDDAGLKRAA